MGWPAGARTMQRTRERWMFVWRDLVGAERGSMPIVQLLGFFHSFCSVANMTLPANSSRDGPWHSPAAGRTECHAASWTARSAVSPVVLGGFAVLSNGGKPSSLWRGVHH